MSGIPEWEADWRRYTGPKGPSANPVFTSGNLPRRAAAWVPLNGSSEDRRESREYYFVLAAARGQPARCAGNCSMLIGFRFVQPDLRTTRGRRLRRVGNVMTWWDRRKWKRFTRKNGAVIGERGKT